MSATDETALEYRFDLWTRRRAWLVAAGWFAAIAAAAPAALFDSEIGKFALAAALPAAWGPLARLRDALAVFRITEEGLEWRRWGEKRFFPFDGSHLSAFEADNGETHLLLRHGDVVLLLTPQVEGYLELAGFLFAAIPLEDPEDAARSAHEDALEGGLVFRHPRTLQLAYGPGGLLLAAAGIAGCSLVYDANPGESGDASGIVAALLMAILSIFMLGMGVACLSLAWLTAQRIELTPEAIEARRLWRRRTARFACITRAGWESTLAGRSFTIRTPDTTIRFSRHLRGYEHLVPIVLDRIPPATLVSPAAHPYVIHATRGRLYGIGFGTVVTTAGFALGTLIASEPWLRIALSALSAAAPFVLALYVLRRTRQYVFDRHVIAQVRILGYREYPAEQLLAVRLARVRQSGIASRFVQLGFLDGSVLQIDDQHFGVAAEELHHALHTLYAGRILPKESPLDEE